PRPALDGVTTPAITAALREPERAWSLLTAPTTPYLERRALAYQWKSTFQLDYLPRLTRALTQLRPEAAAHGWGLDPHPDPLADPLAAALARGRGGPTDADGSRVTSVFGVPWTARRLPDGRRDYPLTWEEEAAAPWPWQVHRTLEELFTSLFPRSTGSSQLAAERAWLEACATLPWASDDDASILVEASLGARRVKTQLVMGLWHAISVSAAHPRAAVLVSRSVADAAYAWDAPESQVVAEVITVDVMASSNWAAREHAAYGLRRLARRSRGGVDEKLPPPSTAILAALVLSQDPAAGDSWKRLYVYGFSALEAMAAPPFVPDRTIAPSGPAAAARADELARWFVTNRASLEAESTARKKTLDPARRALQQLVFNASRRGR
ncbi:MAG TPA: hypothetical protein PK141_27155, partial [Polyangiaceae bacterium]|nr:hypothetical protein [Polyangiaceae bacterium]